MLAAPTAQAATPAAAPPPAQAALAESQAAPEAEPEAGEGGKRRRCGRMIGSLGSRVPEDHPQYFEEREGGTGKCLQCTRQAQKQGSRE